MESSRLHRRESEKRIDSFVKPHWWTDRFTTEWALSLAFHFPVLINLLSSNECQQRRDNRNLAVSSLLSCENEGFSRASWSHSIPFLSLRSRLVQQNFARQSEKMCARVQENTCRKSSLLSSIGASVIVEGVSSKKRRVENSQSINKIKFLSVLSRHYFWRRETIVSESDCPMKYTRRIAGVFEVPSAQLLIQWIRLSSQASCYFIVGSIDSNCLSEGIIAFWMNDLNVLGTPAILAGVMIDRLLLSCRWTRYSRTILFAHTCAWSAKRTKKIDGEREKR